VTLNCNSKERLFVDRAVEHSAYPAGANEADERIGSVQTNTVWSLRSASIPSIPPHSIYKRTLRGYVPIGAMYTAAGRATDEELNVGSGTST